MMRGSEFLLGNACQPLAVVIRKKGNVVAAVELGMAHLAVLRLTPRTSGREVRVRKDVPTIQSCAACV